MIRIVPTSEGARIAVYAQPRASRSELVGTHDGALKVRLQAPPVDGAANAALVRLVAESLGVRPKQVRLSRGGVSRRKEIEIVGMSAVVVSHKLNEALASVARAKRAER